MIRTFSFLSGSDFKKDWELKASSKVPNDLWDQIVQVALDYHSHNDKRECVDEKGYILNIPDCKKKKFAT